MRYALSAPVIASQHVAHRVAPTGVAHEADCGASARKRPGGHFALIEDGILRRNSQIGCEEQFMGNSRHMPLHGDNQRLGPLGAARAERIEKILWGLKRSRPQTGAPG